MRFVDVLRLATRNFRNNRLRTFLTILAVSIATAAILFLVSFGYGLQLLTVQRIANSATISTIDVVASSSKSIIRLDDTAISRIKGIPNVALVSPQLDIEGEVVSKSVGTTVVHAVDAHYAELADLRVEMGALLAEGSDHEAVVSTGFLAQFGFSADAKTVGQEFHLSFSIPNPEAASKPTTAKDDKAYSIKGTLKDDDVSYIYIPLVNAKIFAKDMQYANLKVQASDRSHVVDVKESINGQGYDASAPLETLQQLDRVFAFVQAGLGGLGVIALIISSIGMFNTMTISLLERTREIGIMKALGADKSDVWKLFIAESSIIGFCGGVTGVIVGVGLTFTANTLLNILARLYQGQQADIFYSPPWFMIAIIAFSTLVGAVTGFYPARRAAGLNPLKALRYE